MSDGSHEPVPDKSPSSRGIEDAALLAAEEGLRNLAAAEIEMRNYSLTQVPEQAAIIDEALLLLASARDVVAARGGLDIREKIALTLSTLQWELLRVAWNALLQCRYAATLSSFRLIDELSDYIVAARFDEAGAERLREHKEWGIGDARAVIETELIAKGSTEAAEWVDGRKALRTVLHQLAHTSGALAALALRDEEDGITLPVIPQFRSATSIQMADLIVQLAMNGLIALGIAFGSDLPDGHPWSMRQRTLWNRVSQLGDAPENP